MALLQMRRFLPLGCWERFEQPRAGLNDGHTFTHQARVPFKVVASMSYHARMPAQA